MPEQNTNASLSAVELEARRLRQHESAKRAAKYDFFGKAKAHIASSQYEDGSYAVVDSHIEAMKVREYRVRLSRGEHPDPVRDFWQDWIDFFRYIGMDKSADMMLRNEKTRWTVPEIDPADFDPITAALARENGDRIRAKHTAETRDLGVEARRLISQAARSSAAGFADTRPKAGRLTAGAIDKLAKEEEDDRRYEIGREITAMINAKPDLQAADEPWQDHDGGGRG